MIVCAIKDKKYLVFTFFLCIYVFSAIKDVLFRILALLKQKLKFVIADFKMFGFYQMYQ